MNLLDRSGGGQGASHLDDLDGLIAVADLHPDAATFEAWLHEAFHSERDPAGVTVSTIHRVKGREWDHVAVFGVADGVTPHRLADDVEEERRVLHVGITRGRRRVAVLADRSRRSPFVDELTGAAPHRPPERVARPARPEPVTRRRAAASPKSSSASTPSPRSGRLRDWRTMRAKARRGARVRRPQRPPPAWHRRRQTTGRHRARRLRRHRPDQAGALRRRDPRRAQRRCRARRVRPDVAELTPAVMSKSADRP